MRKLLLTFLVFQFALIQAGLGGIAQAQPPYATADFLGTYGFGRNWYGNFCPTRPADPELRWLDAGIAADLDQRHPHR